MGKTVRRVVTGWGAPSAPSTVTAGQPRSAHGAPVVRIAKTSRSQA